MYSKVLCFLYIYMHSPNQAGYIMILDQQFLYMANSSIMFSLSFLVIIFASPLAAMSFNNDTDLLSLLAIKSVLEDPMGSLSSWNQTTHFCNWTGIRCGRRHPDRVVLINLNSQGLVGSLSRHVGNLSFLRVIILNNNTFHGPIPQEISLLTRLERIGLSNNSFTGAIPKNLSLCRNLVHLNLIDNKLSGTIPTELGSMFKLKALGLSLNKLSGPIPPSIGNLTSLTHLSCWSSGLEGEIPSSLAQLDHLLFLNLGENNLTGNIPSALFNLSAIYTFDVFNNQLQGVLPSTIAFLPNLIRFALAENQFTGPIPASMSNTSLLELLHLGHNHFTGSIPRTLARLTRLRRVSFSSNLIEDDIDFISSFVNSTNLRSLQVEGNLFTGSLPDSIGNLSRQLSWLTVSRNRIHGRIPSAVGNLIGLAAVGLNRNYLEGPIPVSIAKLSNLHYFEARANMLGEELPSSFGNLTSLLDLYLDGNNFSGDLPPSIGNCTNLLELDISRNNFYGFIPPEIMSTWSVYIVLNLSHNLFEGPIPNELGSLRNLEALDLSYNRLSGAIPNSLKSCLNLQQLHLGSNLLEGEIPSALSSLMGLQNLDLSRNNLSGPIPAFLTKLNLEKLNLSFNRLQGEVPAEGIFGNMTSISIDGNRDLCGGILELRVHPCPPVNSRKKGLSTLLKILIPIFAAGVICLLPFGVYTCKQNVLWKNVTPSLPSFTGVKIMRLSYAGLLKATGGFSPTSMVGFGRHASVYKGILDDGHMEIAVKVLNLSVRGASRSFMAEYNALRSARHRNLLRMLNVCESIDFQGNDFNKALVYEFKSNGSLEKWLHQGEQNAESNNLNLMQRLNIAVDIAQGIEYLHSGTDSCIVHGDLKPSNILLDHDMTAYVGDFGLSKFVSDIIPSHESNSSIGIRGTIGYVPPEYGMSCPVSMQGDAYSYGIVLLEMFTNKRPTDDRLEDHVNLHCFVSTALPDQVMEVVDPQFQTHMKNDKIKECLVSVLSIGVSCSKEMPRDRMSMTNAVFELHKIQKLLSS